MGKEFSTRLKLKGRVLTLSLNKQQTQFRVCQTGFILQEINKMTIKKTVKIENTQIIETISKRTTEKYGNTFNAIANTAIERYFEIVRIGKREIRKTFSDSELNLLCDICNGTMFEPFGMILENNAIAMQYEDTLEIYGKLYLEKWQVEDFADKLNNLSKFGQIALIDLIETFWSQNLAEVNEYFKTT